MAANKKLGDQNLSLQVVGGSLRIGMRLNIEDYPDVTQYLLHNDTTAARRFICFGAMAAVLALRDEPASNRTTKEFQDSIAAAKVMGFFGEGRYLLYAVQRLASILHGGSAPGEIRSHHQTERGTVTHQADIPGDVPPAPKVVEVAPRPSEKTGEPSPVAGLAPSPNPTTASATSAQGPAPLAAMMPPNAAMPETSPAEGSTTRKMEAGEIPIESTTSVDGAGIDEDEAERKRMAEKKRILRERLRKNTSFDQ
jgi:hypothetical protein